MKNIETDTYSELPLFMTYEDLAFRAESSQIEDLGEYVISIVPKITDTNQIEQISEELLIELSLVNDKCKGDEITTEFTVDAITFDIGVTPEV